MKKPLALAEIIACAAFLLTAACVQSPSTASSRSLSGIILDKNTGREFAHVEIHLFHLKPNFLAPGSWTKIATVTTDDHGRFTFKTDKHGPYEVRWTDAQGHEYDCELLETDVTSGQPVRIEVDPTAEENAPPWMRKR